MAVMYKDDRQRLAAQIEEWNSNRLDLFALSQPNEVCTICTMCRLVSEKYAFGFLITWRYS